MKYVERYACPWIGAVAKKIYYITLRSLIKSPSPRLDAFATWITCRWCSAAHEALITWLRRNRARSCPPSRERIETCPDANNLASSASRDEDATRQLAISVPVLGCAIGTIIDWGTKRLDSCRFFVPSDPRAVQDQRDAARSPKLAMELACGSDWWRRRVARTRPKYSSRNEKTRFWRDS